MKLAVSKESEVGPPIKPGAQARFGCGRGIFFLLGMALMGLVQAFLPAVHEIAAARPGQAVVNARTKPPAIVVPGQHRPWGEFEYVNLPLEQPEKFLPDTARPLGAPCWFFGTDSREQVVGLINAAALTSEQKEKLLDPRCWQVVSNGFCLFPPPEVVLEMSRPARERIYSVLEDYPANSAQRHPFRFRADGFDEWFAETGLGPTELTLLRKLIYTQGGSLCFCDGAVVQTVFSAKDFNRLVKSLYGERTFLMKLRITPETDLNALVRYWERGGRAQTLRPLLESLAQLPGGGTINVGAFLPPFAGWRLYTYANPAADPTAASQNCLWTALNFFNEKPDDRFLDPEFVQHVLASDYDEISGPPIFGDLITVRGAAGKLVHTCVYLADDVVFTKNGQDYIEPWVLMKVPDMLACYKTKTPVHVALLRARKGRLDSSASISKAF